MPDGLPTWRALRRGVRDRQPARRPATFRLTPTLTVSVNEGYARAPAPPGPAPTPPCPPPQSHVSVRSPRTLRTSLTRPQRRVLAKVDSRSARPQVGAHIDSPAGPRAAPLSSMRVQLPATPAEAPAWALLQPLAVDVDGVPGVSQAGTSAAPSPPDPPNAPPIRPLLAEVAPFLIIFPSFLPGHGYYVW